MTKRPQERTDLSLPRTTGPIELSQEGFVDAHNHLWIDPIPGAAAGALELQNWDLISSGLNAFRQQGGTAVLDCQPGECGRDGHKLRQLSAACRVAVIGCTGFHLPKYYPSEHWLFSAGPDEAFNYFLDELRNGMRETQNAARPVRPGFIKIACQASLADSPLALMEGAARAAQLTGVALAVHTERGAAAEAILDQLERFGLDASRVILCHLDKRPDSGLHQALAERGALLEYDTFFRPKYSPEQNLWPLLEDMAAAGYTTAVAAATDMADIEMWSAGGVGGHLTQMITVVKPRLAAMGFTEKHIDSFLGGNISARLVPQPEAGAEVPKEHV